MTLLYQCDHPLQDRCMVQEESPWYLCCVVWETKEAISIMWIVHLPSLMLLSWHFLISRAKHHHLTCLSCLPQLPARSQTISSLVVSTKFLLKFCTNRNSYYINIIYFMGAHVTILHISNSSLLIRSNKAFLFITNLGQVAWKHCC